MADISGVLWHFGIRTKISARGGQLEEKTYSEPVEFRIPDMF